MAAGLREMQENRGFSENRIDKLELIFLKGVRFPYSFAE